MTPGPEHLLNEACHEIADGITTAGERRRQAVALIPPAKLSAGIDIGEYTAAFFRPDAFTEFSGMLVGNP
jgi:hypothetical protein